MNTSTTYYAFDGASLVQQGPLAELAISVKNQLNHTDAKNLLIFEGRSGQQLDLDLNGSDADIRARYGVEDDEAEQGAEQAPVTTRGRPKLGVVGREVTLLPRHWEWLEKQRGGASAALRRLVEAARREHAEEDLVRQAQDSANRFMTAMAGNLPGFEEAIRALYGRDKARFEAEIRGWPVDVRACARTFAQAALQ